MEKEVQNTYVEILKENLSEEQINQYRQKNKIFKEIDPHNFVKLSKVLKEENNLHFLYEYYPMSLELYIHSLGQKYNGKISKQIYRALSNNFSQNIDNIIDALVKAQVKVYLYFYNLAICNQNDKGNFLLKAFIDPEAQYLNLDPQVYRRKDSKRTQNKGNHGDYLSQFYEAERRRLIIQFDDLLQHIFGKLNQGPFQGNQANFVINGTKLVFINEDKREQKNQKKEKVQRAKEIERGKEGDRIQRARQFDRNIDVQRLKESQRIKDLQRGRQLCKQIEKKFQKGQKAEHQERNQKIEVKKQFLEKNFKKIQQIKQNITNLHSKNSQNKPLENIQIPIQKSEVPQISDILVPKISKIEDFNQSFQPDFKPEEFTKENTYILEQNEYLDSLQEQIQKLAIQKKKKECKKAFYLQVDGGKQQLKKKHENSEEERKGAYSGQIRQNQKKYEKSNPSINNSHSNISSNNDSTEKNNIKSYQNKKEPKQERINIYKMKIITSHEIQIEGGGETSVKEFEKDILEGIKNGKINIKDLTGSNQKQQNNTNNNKSDSHISSQNSNEYPCMTPAKSHNSQKEETKEDKQSIKQTSLYTEKLSSQKKVLQKLKEEIVFTNNEEEYPRNSDLQPSKARRINQIIEKIGIKTAQNPNGTPNPNPGIHTRPDSKPNIANSMTIPKNKNQKVEKSDANEGHNIDSYYEKIREAKNKAQQVLKEYAKSKKQ